MEAEKESPPLVGVLFITRRPAIPHYRPFHCLPLILSCSLLIYPQRLSISLSRFVFPDSLTHTHTPPPFLSHSLLLVPPSPVSCHGCHFLAPTHLLQVTIAEGPFKKDNVSHLNTHTRTRQLIQYTWICKYCKHVGTFNRN